MLCSRVFAAHYGGIMTGRADWPFGAELRRQRMASGLSVKAAARLTNGEVSDGRWYQLESGVQKVAGQEIPISTTPRTVIAAAKAVGWSPSDALEVAGFDPAIYRAKPKQERPVLITEVPLDDLLNEVRRRFGADLPIAAREEGYPKD